MSTSTIFGGGYLEYAKEEIRDFLGNVTRVLFVPFALRDRDVYATKARETFASMGYGLASLHEAADMRRAVDTAEAIFVGGGNTFRLLKTLYDFELIAGIKKRAEDGMPYMGSSAGSNIAAPTIRTTNDMPIVEPPSFNALGLVPFQINPHYLDADPSSKQMGETREERIVQFLEENATPVVGLREGAMLRLEDGNTELKGGTGARLFRRGCDTLEVSPGSQIGDLVRSRPST